MERENSIMNNYSNQHLATTMGDNLNIKSSNETNNSFKEIEQQKFSTFNPMVSHNIRFKKMYWNSKMEVTGRIILIITSILLLVFSYFLTDKLINSVLGKNNIISFATNLKPIYVIYITFAFMIGFNLIFYLPLTIGRNASTMFNWSIVYIILAILYFIVSELFCTILLVVNGIIDKQVTASIPIFMGLILLVTIIWLVGACLLIVKSDDVRKELSVE